MNPFSTRWDEPSAGKEKPNSDRAGRSSELLSVLSVMSYFTLVSVATGENVLVQLRKAKFVKTTKKLEYLENVERIF